MASGDPVRPRHMPAWFVAMLLGLVLIVTGFFAWNDRPSLNTEMPTLNELIVAAEVEAYTWQQKVHQTPPNGQTSGPSTPPSYECN